MYRENFPRCSACACALDQYGERSKYRCPQCAGVMLAPDEQPVELGTVGETLADDLDTARLSDTARGCPACGGTMNQLKIDGVVIERCPIDRTLWFDAGELGQLKEAIVKYAESPLVQIWERYFFAK
ncbi:MAG: zf-TFIIB domain-containing protein [Kofleriaceae bacterium]